MTETLLFGGINREDFTVETEYAQQVNDAAEILPDFCTFSGEKKPSGKIATQVKKHR